MAWAVATLRANVTTSTEAGRHALRLAVIAALAEAIVQAMGLYQGRWATLTIFLVLKPDYRSTLSRGVQRALGTALGAGFGAVAVHFTHPGHGGLVAAAGISIAGAYALFDVNYLLFSVLLTVFIVVLLALLGLPAIPTAEARIFETFIGAALALGAYFTWPTWGRVTAQGKFAGLIEAHRDYATELLRELAHPGSAEPRDLRALQAAARRARSDAEAATVRLSDEPVQARLMLELAQALTATVSRLAHAELALHALVLSPDWACSRPSGEVPTHLDNLRAALDPAMTRIAASLRLPRESEPIPPLRPIATALAGESLSNAPLAALADRLIDAVDTLDAIVRDHFVTAFAGAVWP
jgi:uncharacterized membrane protein YccC